MMPRLICIEISHKTAPLALRERLAADRARLSEHLGILRGICRECVLLRTCGRFELYAVADDAPGIWLRRYAERTGVPLESLRPHARRRSDGAAVEHLLRVAAGLESPIPGEDHILGQVREAFLRADAAGTVGPVLSALFRAAIHAGKRVRHETPIGRIARSYAQDAVALLAAQPRAIRDVLILGAGSLARDVASRLAAGRRRRIRILSRHVQRAAALADELGGEAHALENLPDLVAGAGALIACTSARRHLVDAAMLAGLAGPLLIIDLGMPRNVDPAVARMPGVSLAALDQFGRHEEVDREIIRPAERIVACEKGRFMEWLRARRVGPLIARLRALADGLDPESARRMKRAVHRTIRRLHEGTAA